MSVTSTSRASRDDDATILSTRFQQIRKRLRYKTFYLGDEDAHRHLTWLSTERGDVVVQKSSNIADRHGTSSSHNSILPDDVYPATLSAIVLLTEEDFHLSSDGYWKEPTHMAATLGDVILSCTGAAPNHEELSSDFGNVVANVNALIDRSRSKFNRIKSCFIESAMTLETKLKFCHFLFEVSVIYLSSTLDFPIFSAEACHHCGFR
jgi:hypothetical protein